MRLAESELAVTAFSADNLKRTDQGEGLNNSEDEQLIVPSP